MHSNTTSTPQNVHSTTITSSFAFRALSRLKLRDIAIVYEPRQLSYLDRINQYHLVCIAVTQRDSLIIYSGQHSRAMHRQIHTREHMILAASLLTSPQLYNSLVALMSVLLADLSPLLQTMPDLLNNRNTSSPLVMQLYSRHGIYETYPFGNLIARLRMSSSLTILELMKLFQT